VLVMETMKRVLGEEHPDSLISMGNLAFTLQGPRQVQRGRGTGVLVMETMKRVLGEEHPHSLTSMENLASTYRNQGRWKEPRSWRCW